MVSKNAAMECGIYPELTIAVVGEGDEAGVGLRLKLGSKIIYLEVNTRVAKEIAEDLIKSANEAEAVVSNAKGNKS